MLLDTMAGVAETEPVRSEGRVAESPNAPVEIAPCPGCQTRLSVEPDHVGTRVECPYCLTRFVAERFGSDRPPVASVVGQGSPRRSRRRDDDSDLEDDDRPRRRSRRRPSDEECKKIPAGILALFLGAFGVHKFYLGYTTAGILQIVLTFATCGLGKFLAIAEGIIYLTKTDEEFIETYQDGQKEWF